MEKSHFSFLSRFPAQYRGFGRRLTKNRSYDTRTEKPFLKSRERINEGKPQADTRHKRPLEAKRGNLLGRERVRSGTTPGPSSLLLHETDLPCYWIEVDDVNARGV